MAPRSLSERNKEVQNIHVKRYDHPVSTGYAGTIEPEDGSWVLFIPNDGAMPELFVEVEAAKHAEDDNPEAFEKGGVETIKGYTPAIFLDSRVDVKPEAWAAIVEES
jgi:hypothetical protein